MVEQWLEGHGRWWNLYKGDGVDGRTEDGGGMVNGGIMEGRLGGWLHGA